MRIGGLKPLAFNPRWHTPRMGIVWMVPTRTRRKNKKELAQEERGAEMTNSNENGKQQQGGEQPLRDQAWWEKRAKHFESEYQREKAKRRELQKQFGEDED
jgi:hypothetical protein